VRVLCGDTRRLCAAVWMTTFGPHECPGGRRSSAPSASGPPSRPCIRVSGSHRPSLRRDRLRVRRRRQSANPLSRGASLVTDGNGTGSPAIASGVASGPWTEARGTASSRLISSTPSERWPATSRGELERVRVRFPYHRHDRRTLRRTQE